MAKKKKKEVEKEFPDIQGWYDNGMGAASIKDKLVYEYYYSEDEASELIDEIIYNI